MLLYVLISKNVQTWDRKSKVSYTLQMSFISFLYSENKNVFPDTNKKNIYNSKSLQSSKNFEENLI